MTAIHPATIAEQREALQVGAALLRSVWPRVQCDGLVSVGPNMVRCRATLESTLVLRVACFHTGALIAQSLPGYVTALATEPSPPEAAHQVRQSAAWEVATSLNTELANGPDSSELLRFLADAIDAEASAGFSLDELVEALRECAAGD